ncbi:hypothetical protein [Spirosoma gilvum]
MKRFIQLLIGGTIAFSACQSNETTPADQVSVRLHQSARLSSDVLVRVDSIQDGRCPKGGDIVCISAGAVSVKLLLAKNTDSTTVRLTLGYYNSNNNRLDSTNVNLSNQVYKVILKGVTPYPTSFAPAPNQTAVVQVSRL